MDKTKLCKRLMELRGELTHEELSELSGVPADYLRRLEDSFLAKNPSAHALWKLSKFYGVDYKELLILGGCIVKRDQSHEK